jgi:hypothetical protein
VWRLSTQAPRKCQTISRSLDDKLDRPDLLLDGSNFLRSVFQAHCLVFLLLSWIVSESSLGLVLLIGLMIWTQPLQ